MAGELEPNQDKQLKAEFQEERRKLRQMTGSSVADRQARHEQEARVWTAMSLQLLEKGNIADAAKASSEAVKHGALAVKLQKSLTLDRISALEALVKRARTGGAGIRDAAAKRTAE